MVYLLNNELYSRLLIGLGTLPFKEYNAGSSPVGCTKLLRTGARGADGDRLLICSRNANEGSNPSRFTIISTKSRARNKVL